MQLHFFEDYVKEMFDKSKIDTMFPDEKGNIKMCCPFLHTKKEFDPNTWEEKEVEYYENVPSSSINLDMRVFHCFTCDRTYKELEFAQVVTGKDKESLIREYTTKEELKNDTINWNETQHKALLESKETINKLYDLKISDEAINELSLGYIMNTLAIPVFKNGALINIARYNINKIPDKPKNEYNKNANTGDIVPFDVWKSDFRPTIICEGEKDMIVARSHGFNAITLTGGAQAAMQKDYIPYFKNRVVYICYDNDDVGRQGALKRYKELCSTCNVNIINIGQVCVLNKEDVADFFVKYNKSSADFQLLIDQTARKPGEEELNKVESKNVLKLSKIEDNIRNSAFRKNVKSTLQIVATCTETYAVPEYAIFKPVDSSDQEVETKSWYLSSSHENFLELMEGTVKTMDIPHILAELLNLGKKWANFYKLDMGTLQTMYKVSVTDVALESDDKASEFTVDMYSKIPLEIGSTYEITYKLYPHPKQGRKIIAIASEVEQTNYSFDTDNIEYKEMLDIFKPTFSIESKINELYESAKCHIAPYLNKDIWFMMDLVFNSPLDITYKSSIRGA